MNIFLFRTDEYKKLEKEINELKQIRMILYSIDSKNKKLDVLHEKITKLIYEQAKIMKDDSYEIR